MEMYRAKKLTGGWVYGYHVTVPDLPIDILADPLVVTYTSYIMSADYNDYLTLSTLKFDDPKFPKWEVDPNTVQRNIGVIGNNGVTVYAGDIITATVYPFENFNAVITWIDEYKAYMMQYKKKKGAVVRGIFDGMYRELQYLQNANVDIVGNIIDNPDII